MSNYKGKNMKNKNYSRNGKRDSCKHEKPSNDSRTTKTFAIAGKDSYDAIRTNDIHWWNKAKGVYEYATRIPFTKLAGTVYPELSDVHIVADYPLDNVQFEYEGTSIPSFMRINYTPGIGVAANHTDAANRAFQAMYSALYAKTSGSSLGFPTYILAMHVICTQSIAQNIALVKRALCLSNFWSAQNLATPVHLLKALGIEPTSVLEHQNDIAMRLNNIIRDFNSLKVPSYIDVFKRHFALCKNAYADMDSVRAQYYFFVPTIYYLLSDIGTYNGTEYDGIATAVPIEFGWGKAGTITIDTLMDIIEKQIVQIRNSSDFVQVSGAMQRAFPESSFLSIDMVTPNDVDVPVPDTNISYQINNMDIVGYPNYSTQTWPNIGTNSIAYGCAISGDPVANLVKYKPHIQSERHDDEYLPITSGTSPNGSIINFFSASEVEADNIMEATRLKSQWIDVNNRLKVAQYIGTEFVNGAVIYTVAKNSDGSTYLTTEEIPGYFYYKRDEAGTDTRNYGEGTISALSKFHKGPRVPTYMFLINRDNNAARVEGFGFVGDVLYWTNVTPAMLNGLHTAALLSVFSTDADVDVK